MQFYFNNILELGLSFLIVYIYIVLLLLLGIWMSLTQDGHHEFGLS